jgi:hypothetical protein
MPNATVRANARPMPADQRADVSTDKVASERTAALELLDVVDDIDRIGFLLKAARMAAAGDLAPTAWGDPIVSLLDVISRQLTTARDNLDAARPHQGEPANV